MMSDYFEDVSTTTWTRAVDVINKVGYMDGAADGKSSTLQTSFDVGYKQGLSFGLKLGYANALLSVKQQNISHEAQLTDTRGINCQICINSNTLQNNVVNIYNMQKEKNDEYLQNLKTVEIKI